MFVFVIHRVINMILLFSDVGYNKTLDYTFLTDFFLVYRLFITPISLLKLLMARFQWALANDSSQKHIVRIRTFVTLRHWILSFYEYDFVTSKGVLHKALNRYLKSLHQHPVVAMSTLDQRIVRDLRRHLHAQKKLSRARPHHQGFIGCQCEQVHSGMRGFPPLCHFLQYIRFDHLPHGLFIDYRSLWCKQSVQ